MEEITPCQEYGHVYKKLWYFHPEFRVFEVCDDCGDEYEITEDLL